MFTLTSCRGTSMDGAYQLESSTVFARGGSDGGDWLEILPSWALLTSWCCVAKKDVDRSFKKNSTWALADGKGNVKVLLPDVVTFTFVSYVVGSIYHIRVYVCVVCKY